MINDNTFCASKCENYDCEYHASNVESEWNVFWKDMHHTCKDYIPIDDSYLYNAKKSIHL
jgi:hypothetical protein